MQVFMVFALRSLVVDANGAANGIALPTKFHRTLGGIKYYERVLTEFKDAITTEDFVRIAYSLAEQLLKESGKVK